MSRTWISSEIFFYIYFAVVVTNPCNRLKTTCCYNEYFNEKSKECTVCKNGSIGWNCETPCTSGFHGYLCSTPCECEAHLCDKQTGCQSPQNETSLSTNVSQNLQITEVHVYMKEVDSCELSFDWFLNNMYRWWNIILF